MSTTFTSPTLQNILKGSRVFVFDLVQLYWSYVEIHKGKSKVALNKKHDKKITWVFL